MSRNSAAGKCCGSMMGGMRFILPIVALCAACTSSNRGPDNVAEVAARRYVTQATAPSPNYRVLLQETALKPGAWRTREAALPAPPDARAVGEAWLARLTERGALLGYGLSDRGPDSPVAQVDTGLTEEEFDLWTRDNGWAAPRHIRWSFVSPMNLPSVSAAARNAIRFWPASTSRTGAQNQALFRGRVELRDGCFFAGQFGQPADRLAWFHAEIGLDMDADGYVVLRNRLDGQTLARLGEEMNWGGPATAQIDPDAERALRQACGSAEILIVGSPEAKERFETQYPHMRRPAPALPPPKTR